MTRLMNCNDAVSLAAERKPIRAAHLWVPSGAMFEAGAEAADLASQLGFDVDQEERDVLNVLLAEGPDGKWSGLEAGVFCGRQNIKTWALEISALYDIFLRDIKSVTWSAHLYKTTQQAFADMTQIIENTDWLRKRVKKIRQANGEEGFEMVSGAEMRFLARTKGGGRGLTGDTVILDEALFLTPTQMGALLPTLSSRPNPHVRYGSSPGVLESQVARSIRDRGRAGGDPSLSYIEFSSERQPCADMMCNHKVGNEGCQLDDESKWSQANPALGRRISIDYVRNERRALPPGEFMRERLGWWEDPRDGESSSAIPIDKWQERLEETSVIGKGHRVAFAIDTSWDRQSSWIAICGSRPDGTPHMEIVAQNFGTEWVLPWLIERVEEWNPVGIAIQSNGSPASSLLESLTAQFGDIVFPMSGSDIGKACGALYDVVVNGPMVHIGQKPLDDALTHAKVRPIGDAWVWDRKDSPVDIAPLVAITEAYWVWSSSKNGVSIYETRDLLIL